jgi:sugar phosphate permease
MGAAVQAICFGYVKDAFGWDAIFITIGCLYLLMLILILKARTIKMQKL